MKDKYDIALVVGTRPNFVKAAPLLEYFEEKDIRTLFIHTGQHKDKKMSSNIFDDLNIRNPDITLETPTVNMSEQLSYMLEALDDVFNKNEVKKVGVFGDVTSTLAASLAAKNKKLELFHVESGLRSRNMDMPEERNRIIVDSISDFLFAPSDDAVKNLIAESVNPPATLTGTYTISSPTTITLDPTSEIINDAPMKLKGYTVSQLGSLTASAGAMVYCTHETGGSIPAFYDGTNWRRVSDRAIVS